MLTTIEYTVTAIVCIISAVVIQRIFIKEKLRGTHDTAIQGIKWFGWAIFVWGLGASINFMAIDILKWNASNRMLIYFGVLISLANSLFILLSLPSIEHTKKRSIVVRIIQRFSTREFIGVFCGILGMIAFVFIATSYNNTAISNNFIWLIDIPISVVVAISLLYELNKAFSARYMRFMYLPTVTLFLLILVAVTHRIIPQDRVIQVIDQQFWAVVGSITAISFKFLFILLFSILLYSWKFLSEKEQQQSLAQTFASENVMLKEKVEDLKIANESHLDTIRSMKFRMNELEEAAKVVLSDRQKEVLANLAIAGSTSSYPEIAEAMHISLDGFQTHIHQIKKILNISGAGGKAQLIKYAKDQQLLHFATISRTK